VISYTEDERGADTLSLGEVQTLYNYDKPTFFLVGSNELKPKKRKVFCFGTKTNYSYACRFFGVYD